MKNNIAKIRKELGLTQAQLGEPIGFSQSRIANYETGDRTPDLSACRQIVGSFVSHGAKVELDDVFPPNVNHAAA